MTRDPDRRSTTIAIALVAAVMGAALVAPARAHVGGDFGHLWGAPGHVKDKVKQLFYTKQRSDTRFVNVGEKASNSDKLDGIDSTRIVPGFGNLQQGSTLRGTFALGDTAGDAGHFTMGSISFGFTLKSAPTAHWIAQGDTPPEECPGSSTSPQADAGHLCIYEEEAENLANRFVNAIGSASPSADRWGATIQAGSAAGGDYWSFGSWAVTAP